MGAQHTKVDSTVFDPLHSGWLRVQSLDGGVAWLNTTTNQEIEEYQFLVSNPQEFQYQVDSFHFRYNSPCLVSSKYLNREVSNQICASVYRGDLFLEKIPIRLSKIKQIPYPDVLHLYSQSFRGFDSLQRQVGPFQVFEDLIGINNEGVVKVWVNSDFAKSLPERSFEVTRLSQKQMLNKIIELIDVNTDNQTLPSGIRQLFAQRNPGTFQAASKVLEEYTIKSRSVIPPRMDCVMEVCGEPVGPESFGTTFGKVQQTINTTRSGLQSTELTRHALAKSQIALPINSSLVAVRHPQVLLQRRPSFNQPITQVVPSIIRPRIQISQPDSGLRTQSLRHLPRPTIQLDQSPPIVSTIPFQAMKQGYLPVRHPIMNRTSSALIRPTSSTPRSMVNRSPSQANIIGSQYRNSSVAPASKRIFYKSAVQPIGSMGSAKTRLQGPSREMFPLTQIKQVAEQVGSALDTKMVYSPGVPIMNKPMSIIFAKYKGGNNNYPTAQTQVLVRSPITKFQKVDFPVKLAAGKQAEKLQIHSREQVRDLSYPGQAETNNPYNTPITGQRFHTQTNVTTTPARPSYQQRQQTSMYLNSVSPIVNAPTLTPMQTLRSEYQQQKTSQEIFKIIQYQRDLYEAKLNTSPEKPKPVYPERLVSLAHQGKITEIPASSAEILGSRYIIGESSPAKVEVPQSPKITRTMPQARFPQGSKDQSQPNYGFSNYVSYSQDLRISKSSYKAVVSQQFIPEEPAVISEKYLYQSPKLDYQVFNGPEGTSVRKVSQYQTAMDSQLMEDLRKMKTNAS